MKLPLFVFLSLCVLLTSISGYNFAYAFFMSTAANNNNSFTAAEIFPTTVATPSATIAVTPTGEILVPTSEITPTPTDVLTPTPTSVLSPTPTPTASNIANHLVINEVLYDPSVGQSIAEGNDSASEWIELYNPTNSAIDLAGWKIEDNSPLSGAESLSGTIPSHGFAILSVATEADYRLVWTSVPAGVIFIQSSGNIGSSGLRNDGDRVILMNPSDEVIDKMSYFDDNSQLDPPIPNNIEGHSLERDPDGKDTDTAVDFTDRTNPQPGS